MRLGPIALVKSVTLNRILERENFLTEQNNQLSVQLGAGTTLHSFMHYPWTALTAPTVILGQDADVARSTRAIERVIKAFQLCWKEEKRPSGSSMWDAIEERQKPFVTALSEGNVARLLTMLANLFQEEIIWGLGKFDATLLADVKAVADKSHLQLRITDALVSLAQAVGAHPLACVEQQGVQAQLNALAVDPTNLLQSIERESALDISAPRVGASYGCEIAGQFVTLDSVLHSYSVYRLKQLGASNESSVAEIGGGFGCLAHLAHRGGLHNYAIYDLPWVNAIQGYYLLMSVPEAQVSLYGESDAGAQVRVRPFWCFDALPKQSVDYIINCDSLPEMSSETAYGYICKIKDVVKERFFSINQEAKSNNLNGHPQNSVPELVARCGGFKRLSRSIYWMRQGYAEEVYAVSGT